MSAPTAEQWAYAANPAADRWHGPFPTKEAAIAAALDDYGDPDDHYRPCVSPCRPVRETDEHTEDDWTFVCEGEIERVEIPKP